MVDRLSTEEMKALIDAEVKAREQGAIEAVQGGRGEALLNYFRWQWFAEKSPLTVTNGGVDANHTMFALGQQKAYLDLVKLVEWATRKDADPARERPSHAQSALSPVGAES